jgi:hypothetical protein
MLKTRYLHIYGFIAAGLMVVGCAKPPTAEIADAENAINAAAGAGAADFAPAEFNKAQDALAEARSKVASKDYKAALAGALDAKSKAEMAQAAIAEGMEAARTAAAENIASVEEKLKELKAKSAKMTGKPGADLKSSIKTIESEWTKVVEDNMNGNFAKVTSASAAMGSRIDELLKQTVVPEKPAAKTPAKKSANQKGKKTHKK